MSDRLKAMQRIVAMQAQRKRLAEWKLATIEGRKAAIAIARTELGTFVEDSNITGPLAILAIKQTRRLAEREGRADEERERQRAVVQGAERRHKLAERMTEAVAAEDRVLDERRSLAELIDNAVARQQHAGLDLDRDIARPAAPAMTRTIELASDTPDHD